MNITEFCRDCQHNNNQYCEFWNKPCYEVSFCLESTDKIKNETKCSMCEKFKLKEAVESIEPVKLRINGKEFLLFSESFENKQLVQNSLDAAYESGYTGEYGMLEVPAGAGPYARSMVCGIASKEELTLEEIDKISEIVYKSPLTDEELSALDDISNIDRAEVKKAKSKREFTDDGNEI